MTSVSEFILNFLLNSAWQIPAICVVAALGTWLLKNCSAHYRYLVWITALFFCLVAPVITATQVVPTLTINPRSYSTVSLETATDDQTPIDHTRRRSSHVIISTTPQNMSVITAVYLLFLGFAALRLVRLWNAKERLRRSASFDGVTLPMESALKRCRSVFGIKRVELARSSTARVPYTLGIRRPLIVLPDSFCGDVDEETLLSVIGHEMAHVRRRDLLTKLACELISVPVSFHPVIFLIKRQIERERELACDEMVTRQVVRPETYARSLLRAADLSILPARRGVMLSVFDGRMLEERIMQLTRKKSSLNSRSARAITTAVLGVLCVSPIAGSAFGFSFGPQQGTKVVTEVVDLPTEPASVRPTQDRSPVVAPPRSSTAPQDAQQLARAACEAGRNRDLHAIPSLVAMLSDDRKIEPLTCWNTGRWSPALDTFKHPSPGEQAALALASMGREAFVPLMNQLDSSSPTTRRNAAWAIGELTNMLPGERAAAVPQLINLLLSDTDAWVRMAAARATGELRDRLASPTLTATLGDSDWRVRRLAAWALNEMKEERALPALCDLLLRDSRVEVRVAAAEALGEIRSAAALPSLQRALNDAEASVRAKASWAIAEIEG